MYKRFEPNLVNKVKAVSVLLLSMLILFPVELFAQGPNDPNPCDFGGGVTGSSETCPLDTWVWVLVVVAAILGAAKLYARKNEQNEYS
jgi:hypothetical protein